MPDYQVKEWNETNSPLNLNSYTQAANEQKLWSRLSNYIRLYAVYQEGGLYFDTDVEAVRSFTPLRHHKCFLGFQQEAEDVDWINNAIFGADAGHPFLLRAMELTLKKFEDEGEFYRSPTIQTIVLKEMGLRAYGLQEIDGVTVYPVEYFYPYPWSATFSPDCVTENTYCVHHWAGSWLKREKRKVPSPRGIVGRMLRTFVPKP
jgi:mannosyltransferase OCH1-like enzyme